MSAKFVKAILFLTVSAITIAVLAVSALAGAAPKLTLKMTAAKEVRVLKNGKETVELKPTATMKSGEEVVYTITYTNVGDSDAIDAVISDPVPGGMVYVAGSAQGADVDFSIDKGRTFHKTPKQVLTGPDGRKVEKDAPPEMYTNIRWTVKKIASKGSGSVIFKATVK
jgi:uncharacterized repeat protein (TIGR01451 family)